MILRSYIAALLLLVGCAQSRPAAVTRPSGRTEFICWSPDLLFGASAWRDEANKRFPGAIVLVTHGAVVSTNGGPDHWVIDADPDALCRFLKQAFPGRQVVLATCNPRGDALHERGCWYARDIVWNPPDAWWIVPRDKSNQPGVGSIDAFVEGKP